MDWILILLALVLLVGGVFGAILPGVPGPPLSWLGLLVFSWTGFSELSTTSLVVSCILMIAFTWADYYLPIALVKQWGGTEHGKRGALAGLVLGLFMGPWGILLGPAVGAYLFERFGAGLEHKAAFWSAFGSLVGFLVGTAGKLLFALVLLAWVLVEWIS